MGALPGLSLLKTPLTSFSRASISSLGNSPATSPVITNWLMYSRKDSSFTSASLWAGPRGHGEYSWWFNAWQELRERSGGGRVILFTGWRALV